MTSINKLKIIYLNGAKLLALKEYIAENDLGKFYMSGDWRRLRREVLQEDKEECQVCRSHGIYRKANHVHHVNYLRVHPELALSKYYPAADGTVKRNLISVCKHCHETVCHPERLRKTRKPLTAERWD